MRPASWKSLAKAFLALLMFCGGASGQMVSGRISGTIVDPDGAAIPAAEVTLLNERTGEVQIRPANDTGYFVFPNVPPAAYTVRVRFEGFTTYEKRNLILNANASLALGNIPLSIGSVAETVTVEASGTAVDLDTSGQSQVVTSGQMEGLMSVSRDVVSLMRILPGVSQQQYDSNYAIGGSISGAETNNFAGTRNKWNSFKLDGQPGHNIDTINRFSIPISWDAVEEVTVQPTSYLAEHGRSSGVHINVISKSGTNDFHGNGYWFWRHEQLNANNFFNNRDNLPKPLGRFHTFGGTLGGPIVKDKLFFFVSQEWLRITRAAGITRSTLPTELERQGDFSQSVEQNGRLIPVRDPDTGQQFPGNVIPGNRLNEFGQGMLDIMPQPNSLESFRSEGFNNIMQQRIEQPKTQTQFKIDWLVTNNDRLSFRHRWFEHDIRGQTGVCCAVGGTNFPLQPHHYNFGNQAHLVNWTKTISPNVVNELSGGFYRSVELGDLTDEFDLSGYMRSTYGLDNMPQLYPEANDLGLVPAMLFGGIPNAPQITYDARVPIDAADDRWNVQDTLSWITGNHNLKFGFSYELQLASEGPRAADGYEHTGRFLFNRDGNNPLDSNHPFANALLGNYREYRQSNRKSVGQSEMYLIEWYAQDSWKATRRLSLDFGIRFTKFTPWRLREQEGSGFDPGAFDPANAPAYYRPAIHPDTGDRVAQNPLTGELVPTPLIGAYVPDSGDRYNGLVIGGYPEFGDGFRENPPLQVQPRFGFAMDLRGNGKTVVRGGIGIYKQAIFASQQSGWAVTTAPPFVESPTIFFNSIDNLAEAGGVFFPPGELYASTRSFQNVPTVYKWSFGVQQELGWGTVMDVAYVGNTARHLNQSRQINVLPPGTRFEPWANDPTTNRPLPDNFLRPYQGYQNLSLRSEEVGWSNYNALQVSFNRRYASGIQFGAAYTWSKAMGIGGDDASGLPMFIDYRTYLYGKLNFDQTHILVLNYLYTIPNASVFNGNPFARAVFHGWEIGGITTFSSGFPQPISFAYADGRDRWGGGDSPRVWVREDPILSRDARSFDQWFNTGAFEGPGDGEFGNAPVDVFRGPGINNFDVTVHKRFAITERVNMQLRFEFYNIFNHTQWDGVDNGARFDAQGNQIDTRFGQVISAASAREVQLGVKVRF